MKAWMACFALVPVLVGCGSQTPACSGTPTLTVTPSVGTADHSDPAPGNEQQFQAFEAPAAAPGCATPQWVAKVTPAWTVSDPLHVKISSANDSTNGLATCLGPTLGAVTVTANISGGSSITHVTASLTCK